MKDIEFMGATLKVYEQAGTYWMAVRLIDKEGNAVYEQPLLKQNFMDMLKIIAVAESKGKKEYEFKNASYVAINAKGLQTDRRKEHL